MKIPENVNLLEYMRDLGELESEDLYSPEHWSDGLMSEFDGNVVPLGSTLPWSKTHGQFRMRPGEVTVHAGINGHRKSMVTGQIALWLAQREPVCIASFEMPPVKTLVRMCKQAAGCSLPTTDYRKQWIRWADPRMVLYDRLDTTPSESVLALCYYVGLEMPIKHVFIDSLAKCGMSEDDYNAQKRFMDRLAVCARTTGLHIHMVAHMRKHGDEYQVPGKFDVKGTGALIDLADNLLIHWKNKRKEEVLQLQADHEELSDKDRESLKDPCQMLIVAKQRHGEHEGAFKLWFHRSSLQFLQDDTGRVMDFDIGGLQQA